MGDRDGAESPTEHMVPVPVGENRPGAGDVQFQENRTDQGSVARPWAGVNDHSRFRAHYHAGVPLNVAVTQDKHPRSDGLDLKVPRGSVTGHRPEIITKVYMCIDRFPSASSSCSMATHPHNRPVRFAVVGTGWAGIRHLEAAEEVDSWVKVTSVCDRDKSQLDEVANRFGIDKATTDFAMVVGDDSVDVIDICTPHDSHATLALQAIASGKHVLVEKPIASDLSDAKQMIQEAKAAGLALGVAEHQVYDDPTRCLRRILDDGLLGEVVSVTATWGFRAPEFSYPGRRAWLTNPERGGTGTWMLQGIHRVAQVRALFGEVTSVYAVDSRTSSFTKGEIEATVSAVMKMRSGVPVVLIQSSEMAAPDTLKGITIFGDRGACTLKRDQVTVFDEGGAVLQEEGLVSDPVRPYARELEAFARHIVLGANFPTRGEWELGSLAVVEAGYLSIRRKVPISVANLI